MRQPRITRDLREAGWRVLENTVAATAACRAPCVVQSTGQVDSALGNAAAEAFNSTLEVEFAHRQHFRTRAEARLKNSTWIADFYNTTRRHSTNDGSFPIPFELETARARTSTSGPGQDRSGHNTVPTIRGD